MADGAAEQPEPVQTLARPHRQFAAVVHGVLRALPRAVEDMFKDRATQYAAAIAYRVLFSLFPLTIFLVSIFGLVLQDDELRTKVVNELVDILPVSSSGRQDVQDSIEGIASPLSAFGLVSFIALIWGATGMMASIRVGLEAAMKVERGRPAAHAKLVDVVLVAAAGLLVLVIVGLSAFTAFFSGVVDRLGERVGLHTTFTGHLMRDGTQLVLILIMALLLYRFVPARRINARGAFAGAILTAVGTWGAVRILAIVFADYSRYNLIYGSLAGVTTFLFFVYVVAWILLLGAEFAYAWSHPLPASDEPAQPVHVRLLGVVRGLFVSERSPADEGVSEERARRP